MSRYRRTEIDFVIGAQDDASGTISEALESLCGRTVDLWTDNGGDYPTQDVYILRVDDDGDLVVCETKDGMPLDHSTWAIPQVEIRHVHVLLGSAA